MTKRIIALLLALILTVGLLPTVALAADGDPTTDTKTSGVDSKGNKDNPVHIVKSATTDAYGNGTLKLEAYVTDPMEIVTEDVPLDIVLVLDQSGSMGFCINCNAEYNNGNWSNGSDTCEGVKYELAGTAGSLTSGELYAYYYGGGPYRVEYCNDQQHRHSAGWYWSGERHNSINRLRDNKDLYRLKTGTTNHIHRLDTLRSVLTSFTTSVENKASEKNVAHRIAMVGFASSSVYRNTELLTGVNNGTAMTLTSGVNWDAIPSNANAYYYPNGTDNINGVQKSNHYQTPTADNYKEALVDVSQNAGKTSITNAINALTAHGGTQTDDGLDMAAKIFENNPLTGNDKGRKRIVILFTDGDSEDEEAAKKQASALKNTYNATVYTVGLFAGADQTKTNGNNGFLQNVSSNNGKAPKQGEKSYYLAATDAASLQEVFKQITEEVNKLMLNVGASTVLSDTLSEYFDFNIPADGDLSDKVTFKLVPVDSKDADGNFTWKEADARTLTGVQKPTLNHTAGGSKSFTVTNFDYGANKITRVYDQTTGQITGYTGNKLVIEIPIKADTTKTTGWTAGKTDYPTNSSTDGAKLSYKDEKGNDRSTTVESPKAPVTGYTVTYAWANGNQYMGADLPTGGTYINGQKHDVATRLADVTGYRFEGWYTNEACTVSAGDKVVINGKNVILYGRYVKNTTTVNLTDYIQKTLTATSLPSGYKETFKAKITGTPITVEGGLEITTPEFSAACTQNFTGTAEVELTYGQDYTFKVKEVKPTTDATEGMTYDETEYTLTVKVSDTGEVTTESSNGEGAAKVTITNEYEPGSTGFSLNGKFQKTLNSNTADVPVAGKEFELSIEGTSENAKATKVTGKVTDMTPVKVTGTEDQYTITKSFFEANDKLTLDKAGTYTYTVQEVVPNSAVKGMKYDDTAYTLTITVADNQAGALEVTKAEITGGVYTIENPLNLLSDDSKLTITNTFTAAKLPLDPPTDPTDPAHSTAKIVKNLKSDDTEKSFDFKASITETTYPSHNILPAYGEAKDVKNNDSSAQKAPFSGFGTLVFNTIGEYTFTIEEVVPTDKVPGMTYDKTEHTMVVSVVPIDNKLAVKTVTIDGTEINPADDAWLTITNEYKTPSTGTVTKKTIRSNMYSEIDSDVWNDLLADKGAYIPASDTIVVDKNTNEVTLAYEVSIVGEATATAEVEDDGAEYVTYDSTVDGVTVNYNETTKIATVTFAKAATAKLYYVKTFTRENGKFATAKNFVTVNDGEPIPSDETTITDKDPGSFDFSGIIQKELKLTGSKSFTGAEFEATLTLKDFKQVVPFNSMLTTYADEHVEAWPEGWSRTLVAKFDTTAVDGSTTNFLTTDGNHLFLDFPAAGTYTFELQETNKTCTNVTYDDTVYTIEVVVTTDKENSNKLVVTYIEATYVNKDGNDAITIYVRKEATGYVMTFVNTVDTGKDDYYPIIIPTIINKDTGMLNKTDHFAYVIGYPDGTVHPNGQITRAEVATIFFRLLRDEVRDGAFTTSNTYSDVAYGKWYNNPISTMSALGIITGYPDGTFKPNKPITRAEFAAIAARFDETQSGKSATFSDVIGHWAAKEIGIAYYNDWIKGYPDGTFKPDQNITRAEAMTLINRVLERKPESPADLLTNMNKWTDNMDTSKWYYLDVQEATNSHGYTRKTFNYELWRQMLPDPDWSRYER